jgi:hypothetical protein
MIQSPSFSASQEDAQEGAQEDAMFSARFVREVAPSMVEQTMLS